MIHLQNPDTSKITDFFTFYYLPSQVMQSTKHKLLEAAYLFYYASDVAFELPSSGLDSSGLLSRRLTELIGDALIIADQVGLQFSSNIEGTLYIDIH